MKLSMLCTGPLMLAAAALLPTSAQAQRSSWDPGNYWEVSDIAVEDGQFETYMDWLNANWKPQHEWMKSKGYILDYYVLSNGNRRDGEPDLYLVTIFKQMPSAADEKKMHEDYISMMKTDEHKLDMESGMRVKMRRLMGSSLLRELMFKK